MDSVTILVIALFAGIFILSFVLRVVLYKGYDKVRNEYVMRKNAQQPHQMSRLSDRYDSSDYPTGNNQHYTGR